MLSMHSAIRAETEMLETEDPVQLLEDRPKESCPVIRLDKNLPVLGANELALIALCRVCNNLLQVVKAVYSGLSIKSFYQTKAPVCYKLR